MSAEIALALSLTWVSSFEPSPPSVQIEMIENSPATAPRALLDEHHPQETDQDNAFNFIAVQS
ncbi:MAG: hypothetical protein DLM64_07605 [Solirubrobacterales bacterium]|nr:MAG: hypothetical protein DLM64_07605 [Solirubrobacterales bacterium]